MDSGLHPAEAATVPSELMGQLPRRTRITDNGIQTAIAATGLLAAAVFFSYIAIGNTLQAAHTRNTLRRESKEATGEATGTYKSRVDYIFTVDGRSFTGRAAVPDQIAGSLKLWGSLPIRYLPSNPAVNHPAAWEEFPSPWLGIAASILCAAGALLPLGWLRDDRRLVAEGKPTVALATKWVLGSKGGVGVDYEFRTEFGNATIGSSRSAVFERNDSSQKSGALVCVLYLPTNPRHNRPYEGLGFRVAQ